MNRDRIEGKWKQFMVHIREQWGEITNDPFEIIKGKRESLAGKVQEAHGISRNKTDNLLTDFHKRMKGINYVQ